MSFAIGSASGFGPAFVSPADAAATILNNTPAAINLRMMPLSENSASFRGKRRHLELISRAHHFSRDERAGEAEVTGYDPYDPHNARPAAPCPSRLDRSR